MGGSYLIYKYQEPLFAKCIRPRYTPIIRATEGSGKFEVRITGNINFNCKDLIEVLVSIFKNLYSEIRTFSGDLEMHKCGHFFIMGMELKNLKYQSKIPFNLENKVRSYIISPSLYMQMAPLETDQNNVISMYFIVSLAVTQLCLKTCGSHYRSIQGRQG
ncbi:uncharacterized protein VP01_400g12 [Puccinia sorghi]|uniref:Uncharacterized protein n=1 Tax=Puccinia sorghi TaxID=27349 RepID=A0A0L6URW2_9BASI|nr:uncharacterized protein VP01_400g12 [Puccinia sorghi]